MVVKNKDKAYIKLDSKVNKIVRRLVNPADRLAAPVNKKKN